MQIFYELRSEMQMLAFTTCSETIHANTKQYLCVLELNVEKLDCPQLHQV